MKTKEFIKKVKALNYGITEEAEATYIHEPLKNWRSWILNIDELDTASFEFDKEDSDLKHPDLPKLMKLAVDYILTLIDERKEETKFRVHLLPGEYGWLNNDRSTNDVYATDDDADKYYQTTFTNNQYIEIRSKMLAKGYVLPEYDKDNKTTFVPVEDKDND